MDEQLFGNDTLTVLSATDLISTFCYSLWNLFSICDEIYLPRIHITDVSQVSALHLREESV